MTVSELRRLADVRAPAGFAARVLRAVGLVDEYVAHESAIGRVYVAWNARGVSAVMRVPDAAAFEQAFRARYGRRAERAEAPPAWLHTMLKGNVQRGASRRFDLSGLSEFERAVLLKALEIPKGQVRPYAWIAREIGRPKAVRAVGTALAKNPVPIVIPCHRVVRSDGAIGEYALGAERKPAILAAEGVDVSEVERLAAAGIRYVGRVAYCYPTCSAARRLHPGTRIAFHSPEEALAAGLRPCKLCRPPAAA
jgi:O-6-methylguanine DNA methyltransferase